MSQPPPQPNDRPATWDLIIKPMIGTDNDYLIEQMRKRDHLGLSKYGVRLQSHNGRNSLRDAFDEILDAVAYLRNAIAEEDDFAGTVQIHPYYLHMMEIATVMAREIKRREQAATG